MHDAFNNPKTVRFVKCIRSLTSILVQISEFEIDILLSMFYKRSLNYEGVWV
jgi:hypothetical protein